MILAVIAAHMTAMWRNTADSSIKYRNQMLLVLLALVLVISRVQAAGGFMF